MAEEKKISGTDYEVKVRSLWAVALLPFITLGIYNLVWWYKINRELRDYGQAKGHDLGQNPTNSLLAFFPGSLIIVPALVSLWRGFKRVQSAAEVAGKEPLNGWIALILYLLLAPALWAYIQSSLNTIWESEPPDRHQAGAEPGQRDQDDHRLVDRFDPRDGGVEGIRLTIARLVLGVQLGLDPDQPQVGRGYRDTPAGCSPRRRRAEDRDRADHQRDALTFSQRRLCDGFQSSPNRAR